MEQVANQGLPTIQTATTNARISLPCVEPEVGAVCRAVSRGGGRGGVRDEVRMVVG